MVTSISECAPYLSMTLFWVKENRNTSADSIKRAILREFRETPSKLQRTFHRVTFDIDADLEVDLSAFRYLERRIPAWYQGSELTDLHNHLVVVIRRGGAVSITFSSPTARNAIVKSIRESKQPEFSYIRLFSARDMEKAFVEHQVRTLWLNSTHGQSAIKPDSKVLAGLELESALDPLEDQAYYYSSLRSTSRNRALSSNEDRHAVVGVRPTRGQVWIGSTASWNDYLRRSAAVLRHAEERLARIEAERSTVPVLARPMMGVEGIEGVYGIALIVPENMETGVPHVDDEERWLEQFQDAAQFADIVQLNDGPDFTAKVHWNDRYLGQLRYMFKEVRDGARLSVKGTFDGDAEHLVVLERICKDPDNLTIYFESGHTFARGRMFLTNFRDAQFEDWRWVNMGADRTEIDKEKPYDGRKFDVAGMGGEGDTSLFGLVARHWPNLEERGEQTGWLVCDDGSMESADFIHLDDALEIPELTLIHVKGSGSNDEGRGISVSDYQVVVGQAVKNLRHIDRLLLKEKLERNGEGQLKNAVWHNGNRQENRDGIIGTLRAVGSRMKKKVVVLQPRVRRSEYHEVREMLSRDDGPVGKRHRLRQLDALLLSARANCLGLGAEFKVIGDDDGA